MSTLLIQDIDSGLSGFTFGISAFFGCAPFMRAASFSDVGMVPWQ
ncbi:hypothetical protein [Pseudomonas putida]|nr:hypothetical protein [Pseudomonas putida]